MNTIFVSITSFCDPHLQFTLQGLFATAVDPARLRVTVIDQSVEKNRQWIAAQPWSGQVQYIQFHPVDSRGCSWARSVAFSCYRGEDFLLQIDSHTLFDPGWDKVLIEQLKLTQTINPKSILTAYPPPFDFDAAGNPVKTIEPSPTVLWMQPMPGMELKEDDLTLRFQAEHVFDTDLVVGHHIAGGLIFTSGDFVHDVPYDPYMYFHGDEQNIAIRAFTRGWTIYNMRNDRIPLYHLYRTAGIAHPTQHWNPEFEKWRIVKFVDMEAAAKRRLIELVTGQRGDQPLGLGHVASVADFAAQSGIDYLARTITVVAPELVRF
jgi:glycosyltransferase involved in cell wall biosynthesis